MKRASIHTLGCRLNQAESALLAERLTEAGYTLVPFGEPAELGILHTCTVTREADAKSRKLIRQFIRKNPHAFTAVIGCYAQMGAGALADIEGIDLILGNQEKLNVLHYVGEGKNAAPVVARDRIGRRDFIVEFSGAGPRLTQRANLKIQDGCDFMCGFCIIPFARGRARSRDLDNLAAEAESLVARGAKEIVLNGVNLGVYAYKERSVMEVVDRLNQIAGLKRIRIGSIEPMTIPDGLFERMAAPAHALVPHLHVPFQSGSNRILEAMRRSHTREQGLDLLAKAASQVSGIGLGTDLMVGFPGETEEDFADTCSFLRDSSLGYAHIFRYSERPGTAACRMPGKVAPEVAESRSAELRAIGEAKHRAFGERHIGACLEVLFETQDTGRWIGHTGNYMSVAAISAEDLANQLRKVTIERVEKNVLAGNLLG